MHTQIDVMCQGCGKKLIREGKVKMTLRGLQYDHRCPACRSTYLLPESFPVILKGSEHSLEQYQQMAANAVELPIIKES